MLGSIKLSFVMSSCVLLKGFPLSFPLFCCLEIMIFHVFSLGENPVDLDRSEKKTDCQLVFQISVNFGHLRSPKSTFFPFRSFADSGLAHVRAMHWAVPQFQEPFTESLTGLELFVRVSRIVFFVCVPKVVVCCFDGNFGSKDATSWHGQKPVEFLDPTNLGFAPSSLMVEMFP